MEWTNYSLTVCKIKIFCKFVKIKIKKNKKNWEKA